MTSKKHISILVVLVFLFTSLFSSFAFAADEVEMELATDITITANAHVQSHGDMPAVTGKGEVKFGTEGQKRRLENFSLKLEGAPADMAIAYQAHVQTRGDLEAVVGPALMGTKGEKKRVEQIAIALVDKAGELYEGYSVEYRVHQQSYGWSKWVKDGEFAGVRGEKKRIEAVEVKIYKEANFEVTKVTADNLKKITLSFNKEVDEDTLGKISLDNADATLLDDGKTVVLVLKDSKEIAQGAKVKVKVDGLKSVDGDVIEGFVWEERVFDTKVPAMVGAAVLNHKQIVLYFDEPVNTNNKTYYSVLANVKLDGISVIAKLEPNYVNNSVIVEFPSLLKNGTQELAVSEFKDFAGLEMASYKTNITVVEDKEAPVMTNIEVKNVNTIHVTFNEKLIALGEFWVNGRAVDAAPVADTNGTVVALTRKAGEANDLVDLSAVVELKVEYKGQKDVAENEVKDKKSLTTKIADDTSLPTVTYEVKANNDVVVTFSKSMLTTEGTYTVLNKDGKVHGGRENITAPSFKADTNNTVLELSASVLGLDAVDPGQYTLVLKGFKDATVRKNLLPEQKIVINAGDKKAPKVEGYFTTNKDTVTVYFSEAMDKASVENWSNYAFTHTVDGKSKTENLAVMSNVDSVKLASDGKSVTISFKENKLPAIESILVTAVKDVAGNMAPSTPVGPITGTGGPKAIEATTVTAIAVNKIKVEFNQALKSVDPSLFSVWKEGVKDPVAVFISATLDGNTVTFVTNKDIETDSSAYYLKYEIKDAIVSVYDVKVPAGTTRTGVTVDKVAPSLDNVAAGTTPGSIVITFTEALKVDAADFAKDVIVRKDGAAQNVEAGDITVSGKTVTIQLAVDTKYTVELISRNVEDLHGNVVNAFGAKEVTTKAAK